jgi:hypothetical protein
MGNTGKYSNRRSGKERRDWDEFVLHDRRQEKRRVSPDRRGKQQSFESPDRRRPAPPEKEHSSPSSSQPLGKPGEKTPPQKSLYTTSEAAEKTGISQATLLLWIRNRLIDDAKIKRDPSGRRIWRAQDLETIREIKKKEGWR